MARGTNTELRRRVWRLRVVVGYDAAMGNPRQLSRTVRGGIRIAELVDSGPGWKVNSSWDQNFADSGVTGSSNRSVSQRGVHTGNQKGIQRRSHPSRTLRVRPSGRALSVRLDAGGLP
jgi:hypothetical protein